MLACYSDLRALFWSELCVTDVDAYRSYLTSVENGLRIIAVGDVDGTRKFPGGNGGISNDDFCFEPQACISSGAWSGGVVDSVADCSVPLGAKDHVDGSVGKEGLDFAGGRVPVGSLDHNQRGFVGGGVDESIHASDGRFTQSNAQIDGRPVVMSKLEKNRAGREKKREKKRKAMSANFLNYCSDTVRTSLAESRAKVFMLENEHRSKVLETKVKTYNQDYGLARRAVAMVQGLAGQSPDSVRLWADRISCSSAESLASTVDSLNVSGKGFLGAADVSHRVKLETVQLEENRRKEDKREKKKKMQTDLGKVKSKSKSNQPNWPDLIDYERRERNGGFDYIDPYSD